MLRETIRYERRGSQFDLKKCMFYNEVYGLWEYCLRHHLEAKFKLLFQKDNHFHLYPHSGIGTFTLMR